MDANAAYDFTPPEAGSWVDEARKGMENALKADPLGLRRRNGKQLRDLQEE